MKTIGRCIVLMAFFTAALLSCYQDNMKHQQLELRSQLERAIADVNLELERVKREAQGMTGAAEDKMDAQVDKLEQVRDDLSDKLEKVGDTTADDWDAFRLAVDRSLKNSAEVLKEVKEIASKE